MHLNKSDLKEAFKKLRSDFDGVLPWKWDSDTIRKAPDIVKTNIGHLGDLRRGQMFFTSDPEGNVFIFAA